MRIRRMQPLRGKQAHERVAHLRELGIALWERDLGVILFVEREEGRVDARLLDGAFVGKRCAEADAMGEGGESGLGRRLEGSPDCGVERAGGFGGFREFEGFAGREVGDGARRDC